MNFINCLLDAVIASDIPEKMIFNHAYLIAGFNLDDIEESPDDYT